MTSFRALRDDLQGCLGGVNRYNPQNLETLEPYVRAQAEEDMYDLDANLTVLKLYQLNPDRPFDVEVVGLILLKAMMALPQNDAVLAKYLIDAKRMWPVRPEWMTHEELPLTGKETEEELTLRQERLPKREQMVQMEKDAEHLSSILHLHRLLENCTFAEVWPYLEENKRIIQGVKGFEDAIRRFIGHTVSITYQTIDQRALLSLLGDVSEKELKNFIRAMGWAVTDDGIVSVANHEHTVKSRNIEEKVEFTSIQQIVQSIK